MSSTLLLYYIFIIVFWIAILITSSNLFTVLYVKFSKLFANIKIKQYYLFSVKCYAVVILSFILSSNYNLSIT